jgi:hypothetical protein
MTQRSTILDEVPVVCASWWLYGQAAAFTYEGFCKTLCRFARRFGSGGLLLLQLTLVLQTLSCGEHVAVPKKFSPAFKRDVVRLARRGDLSQAEVAADFDICVESVRRWVRQSPTVPCRVPRQRPAQLLGQRRHAGRACLSSRLRRSRPGPAVLRACNGVP